jgi:hypothetical protein
MPKTERSEFERFVRTYGVERLAAKLEIHPSAIYHWLRGINAPRPNHAAIIRSLAKENGVVLTLDDVYGHVSERRASDPGIAVAIDRHRKNASALQEKRAAREAAAEILVKSMTARRSVARP